jgi:hypothetical protein
MSGTRRRPKADREEQPLPERARLNPPADFVPTVQTVMEPAVHPQPVGYRPMYLDGPTRYYHVVVERHEQVTCTHEGYANLYGHALCNLCGAECWSKWWVADGIYGLESALNADALDGTGEWLDQTAKSWEYRAMQTTDPGHQVQ